MAALTASLRGGAALAGLMVIPLAVPILIFGAGTLARPDTGGLLLTAALSLGLCAVAPFVAGAALKGPRAKPNTAACAALGALGEDFHPVIGDGDRMFELRRQRLVARDRSPAVAQDLWHAAGRH